MMLFTAGTLILINTIAQTAEVKDYPIRPVPFTAAHIADGFWAPRMETNRSVTVRYCFKQCEDTGRINNFAIAAGMMKGDFEGIFFNDSDVYKVIEGASYSLALKPDPELDKYLDDLIAKIAGAQEDDGYLYTIRTIKGEKLDGAPGPARWSNLGSSHELYNIGHLYEAAVAHYLATRKRSLLDVAIKSADLVDRTFGPGKKYDVPGHEEIEIGLVKLYRVTGEKRYLDLAKFFIDERGDSQHRTLYGPVLQDHIPFIQQTEPVGHAVRAGYLYTGAADVAVLTGDEAYVKALDTIWQNTVSSRQYITGGVGASREGEAFGQPYGLPNKEAYNETCAAIANALWNQRMFLLHGDSKYLDVLERVIYNGFLSGVSFSGDRFFYPNPLECDGRYAFNHGSLERQPWFGCSCCPVNVVRFIPSLAGYVYAQRDDGLYVNLYAAGSADADMNGVRVKLTQETKYPWEGTVNLTVEPEKEAEFAMLLRIPGWAKGSPFPSDFYRYADAKSDPVTLGVNGDTVPIEEEKGFARIARTWKAGDVIELNLPMPIRRVLAHDNVKEDAGRVALERGPIVYCVEAVDNGGCVRQLAIQDDAKLKADYRGDLLNGVTVITGPALAKRRQDDKSVQVVPTTFTAIPYYAWDHRGVGEMDVWIPRTADLAEPEPLPTIASTSKASASQVWQTDTALAMNDQQEPANSNDSSIPRMTWWDHRGSVEWATYEFAKPAKVSKVAVYWFDDTGVGQCRVPASWQVLYRDGDKWLPVHNTSPYTVDKDKYNEVTFDAVETDGLRIQVQLQPEYSGGILEWHVEAP